MAATHLATTWTGCDAPEFFGSVLGRPCVVLNDADAAGLAEMRFGAGVGETGVVLMLTLGTGIGSALFVDGQLVPNLEFGHIEIDGAVAEDRAAARPRETEHLSWEEWAGRLETYLLRVDKLVWPDVILLGGEITVEAKRFLPLLDVRPRIVIARLRNAAGVVGAALASARG
jgi:polyphosphate glucokinase